MSTEFKRLFLFLEGSLVLRSLCSVYSSVWFCVRVATGSAAAMDFFWGVSVGCVFCDEDDAYDDHCDADPEEWIWF